MLGLMCVELLVTSVARSSKRIDQPNRTFSSMCDQPILTELALQLTRTSTMALGKFIDGKKSLDGAMPDVTVRLFVRSASLANLVVATLVFIEFSVMAIINRNGEMFQLGLSLIPLVTIVIWGTTAVIFVGALTPKWLGPLGRRVIGTSRSSISGSSGVWDHWLDSPETHGP